MFHHVFTRTLVQTQSVRLMFQPGAWSVTSLPSVLHTGHSHCPTSQEALGPFDWWMAAVAWTPADPWRRIESLRAQMAFLQGERRGQENLKKDLVRRIKMLEYALKQERAKYHKVKYGTDLNQGEIKAPSYDSVVTCLVRGFWFCSLIGLWRCLHTRRSEVTRSSCSQ
ncbi:unnamed protein product [Pleuronectes platessa]|uniref:Striatin N-terminal domain-containing protein n=1 Tax=Pleuronectes platessa TaxID=8262 RepID=A0A9N7TRT8_PLEPL|nr:unnamed protein product [Pleuronectes platessa]